MNETSFPIQPTHPTLPLMRPEVLRAEGGRTEGEGAAKDFESVLLHKLLEAMERTIPRSGLFEDGTSRQVRSMFWSHLAEELADAGGMGLWKQLQEQMQQMTPPPPGGEDGPALEQEL